MIGNAPSFETFVAAAFDQIRGSAAGNVAIMLRMLGALHAIANATQSTERRRALSRHVDDIAELAQRTLESPYDRARFDDRLTKVRKSVSSRATQRLYEAAEDPPGRRQSTV